jgi:transposase, IS5 family
MQRQGSFVEVEYAGKKKRTRRDRFLAEMERVVPWARLVARLQPWRRCAVPTVAILAPGVRR